MNQPNEKTPGNQAPSCRSIPLESIEKMRREGWATMEEQKAYWDRKLRDAEMTPVVQIMDALEEYFGDMVKASEKLKGKMAQWLKAINASSAEPR